MSNHRGHAMSNTRNGWVYDDTRQPVRLNPNRACGECGLPQTPEGHDGCLGTLPGVMNACCGHGRAEDAYVQMDSGQAVYGAKAIRLINRLKQ